MLMVMCITDQQEQLRNNFVLYGKSCWLCKNQNANMALESRTTLHIQAKTDVIVDNSIL